MLGVISNDNERDLVGEFFELFKTPWEFYDADVHLNPPILLSRVDYGRRKVSQPPVSRSPSPNRACAFRYALGSSETITESGHHTHRNAGEFPRWSPPSMHGVRLPSFVATVRQAHLLPFGVFPTPLIEFSLHAE